MFATTSPITAPVVPPAAMETRGMQQPMAAPVAKTCDNGNCLDENHLESKITFLDLAN